MIGIFDSGSGGLTVLEEVKKITPKLDVVYFADFKNLPYGEKTPEELGALTVSAIELLLDRGVKNIVSACNSVSASVAQPLVDILGERDFGMLEMVGPSVKKLLPQIREGARILLVATEATVKSGIYHRRFEKEGVSIQSCAISKLVPAIESGASDEEIYNIIYESLKDKKGRFDILILGCTQYPLVQGIFETVLKEMENNTKLFNPAEAVAQEVARRYTEEENGSIHFVLSSTNLPFEKCVKKKWGDKFPVTIEKI